MHLDRSSQAADATMPGSSQPRRTGVTWRAILLGLLLIPPVTYWHIRLEMIPDIAYPTRVGIVWTGIFALLIVCLLNRLIGAVAPRWTLRQSELLLIYSMIVLGSLGASHDFIRPLMPVFTWSFWTASPANNWDSLINPHMPRWLTVRDQDIMRGFYEGGRSFFQTEILQAWAGPVIAWTVFIVLLAVVMVCINSLIRRRWLDDEHLACPLVMLPIEISRPRPTIYTNKLFWIGFGFAGLARVWNHLTIFYPALPEIPLGFRNLAASISQRPWSAVSMLGSSFRPWLIGLGFIMPADFTFSFWFFHLFWKGERVLGAIWGLDQIKYFPFPSPQAFGVYILIGLYALWLGREHLSRVYNAIITGKPQSGSSTEPVSYRVAAVGVIVGVAGLIWFSTAMGMQLWVAASFFLIYFLIAFSITRMRAQFGVPIHRLLSLEGQTAGPLTILTAAFGTRSFLKSDLVGFSNYFWFNRAYGAHPMPHQMEALKMQDQTAGTSHGTPWWLLAATFVGTIACFVMVLHLYYMWGAGARAQVPMWAPGNFTMLTGWFTAPKGPEWGSIIAVGVGVLFGFFLQTMRMRFVNWPLHPLSFAVSGEYMGNHIWMPMFFAWLIKSAVTRYGGHKLYQRLVPLFLGLVMGEFVLMSLIDLICLGFGFRRLGFK